MEEVRDGDGSFEALAGHMYRVCRSAFTHPVRRQISMLKYLVKVRSNTRKASQKIKHVPNPEPYTLFHIPYNLYPQP
jgi:hypothetical protein